MTIYDQITVPTLVLNQDTVKTNIHAMAEKTKREQVLFRPHFKTHQSIEIGRWFRAQGVHAITVSSLRMAAYFALDGWQDITVAFPVNLREIDRINQLAAQIQLGVLLEDANTVQRLDTLLQHPVQAWIKVDAGYHRTGLSWDKPQHILACAQAIQNSRYLRFAGLLTHGGNSYHTPKEEIPALFAESIARMQQVQQYLRSNGIEECQISVGDTPGCCLAPSFNGADEIRPGNFVYFDAQQLQIGSCAADQIAAVIACPVVALHPERSEAVIYGGAIHLAKDTVEINGITTYGMVCLPARDGNGWSQPIAGAYVKSLSQEHGIVVVPQDIMSEINIGDLLCIIPAHSCLSANLLGSALTLEGQSITMFSVKDS